MNIERALNEKNCKTDYMDITRTDFLKKIIRILMITVLALVAMILGNRVVTGAGCSGCPENGICKGLSSCSK
jgi:hypothetical protein